MASVAGQQTHVLNVYVGTAPIPIRYLQFIYKTKCTVFFYQLILCYNNHKGIHINKRWLDCLRESIITIFWFRKYNFNYYPLYDIFIFFLIIHCSKVILNFYGPVLVKVNIGYVKCGVWCFPGDLIFHIFK